jgi:hypothetical protein
VNGKYIYPTSRYLNCIFSFRQSEGDPISKWHGLGGKVRGNWKLENVEMIKLITGSHGTVVPSLPRNYKILGLNLACVAGDVRSDYSYINPEVTGQHSVSIL